MTILFITTIPPKSIIAPLLLFVYLLHYAHSLMKIAWPGLFPEWNV